MPEMRGWGLKTRVTLSLEDSTGGRGKPGKLGSTPEHAGSLSSQTGN